jgi:hypothetical protein
VALAEGQTGSVRERAIDPDQVIQRQEESKVLTGKERLGNKSMDEQRVDNLRWSRLSEQIFRVDKWSLCRG